MSRGRNNRWSPEQLAAAYDVDETELQVLKQWAPQATEVIGTAPIDSVRPSPFQPRGRPSARAVESVAAAVEACGGIVALMEEDGSRFFQALDAEGKALAELAADIAEHGVESPLEVRRVPGGLELLSGHRRLAAARLAARSEVPVVDRGELPDHLAAAIVYRRNLLRKDFTAWQEAVSFFAIQRNRREAGLPDSVRAVARALGSSHGRAGDLLAIARAFPMPVLSELGDGNTETAEEALARLSFRTLRELATEPDVATRIAVAREVTGLGLSEARAPRARHACERVDRRGGGFVLTVRTAPERMSEPEVRQTLALLEAEVRRFRERLDGGA